MGGGPVIPLNERFPSLREFLLGHSRNVARIRTENRGLIPEQASPFLYLCYPWIAEPMNPEQEILLATRRAQFEAAGFNGDTVRTGLENILQQDRHLRECCPKTDQLAYFLNMAFVAPASRLVEAGATEDVLDRLLEEFTTLTYGQGRFRRIAMSHLFNFEADEPTLRFGNIRIERLDGPTISMVLGEASIPSFIHPLGVGDFFVVSEQEGPRDDLLRWLYEERNNAQRFAQVLQYLKDGVVHIDYSVPHFLPQWVNQIRKWGIFFVGNPRRSPYENGNKFYRVNREEVQLLTNWWAAYQSPRIVQRMAEEHNTLRQSGLRAGEYYELSHTQANPVDRLINLAIALEALFSPSDQSEFTFRISQTASQLVGATPKERDHIFKAIKAFYRRRSALFHGQYNVEEFYAGRFVTHEQCDNWASIIRRAVLRFLVLFLRGENQRESVLDQLVQAALNVQVADSLRERSDPQRFLDGIQPGP